ncbi:MAG TPA: hypothetical protein VFK10_04670 [Burkholderiaceae bacterium]|nr:hypothetical protein [Burkholderiaceae bacterium]
MTRIVYLAAAIVVAVCGALELADYPPPQAKAAPVRAASLGALQRNFDLILRTTVRTGVGQPRRH